MDKELEKLLDNYENAIYGKVFPINPSIHQLHLLIDYIANLEQQCKKQKKINQKAIEYIKKAQLGEFPTGVIYWLKDDEVGKILLQILEDKEVS